MKNIDIQSRFDQTPVSSSIFPRVGYGQLSRIRGNERCRKFKGAADSCVLQTCPSPLVPAVYNRDILSEMHQIVSRLKFRFTSNHRMYTKLLLSCPPIAYGMISLFNNFFIFKQINELIKSDHVYWCSEQ